jgi:CRISPR system Cascade subunit CasD
MEVDNNNLADQLYEAVLNPYRIPFLGRKSCLPGLPISQPGPPVSVGLREALLGSPWLARPWEYEMASRNGVMVTMSIDYSVTVRQAMDLSGKKYLRVVRQDNPISFDHARRCHESRVVLLTEEHLPKEIVKKEPWIGKEVEEDETVTDETESIIASSKERLDQPAGIA